MNEFPDILRPQSTYEAMGIAMTYLLEKIDKLEAENKRLKRELRGADELIDWHANREAA